MKKLTLALASATALISAPVLAADLGAPITRAAPAAVVAPTQFVNWSGFYIGGFGGYGWGRARFEDAFGRFREDTDGGFGGGLIGFNWQAPGSSIVWGIEADAAGSNIRVRDPVNFGPNEDYRLRSFGTVRGRVGVAFGNMLAYGTGGYAWGNFRATDGAGINDSQTHSGWAGGVGLEWAFAPAWSAKVEYLYMDFERRGYFGGAGAGGVDIRSDVHTIKGGINYRFNWGGVGGPVVASY